VLGTDGRIILKSLLKNSKGRLRTLFKWLIKARYFVHGNQSLLSIKDEILLLEMPAVFISALSYCLNVLFCSVYKKNLFPSTINYYNKRM